MSLVTPGMLSTLRAVGYANLDSVAEIRRATVTETDWGVKEVYSTIATDVPCWIRGVTVPGIIGDIALREAVVGTFRIHFQVGVDVRGGDRLIIEGSTFEVTDTNTENTIQIFHTAMARKIE